MSKLYTVLVRHCAPKDRHDAIEALVIADDEATLRDKIDDKFANGIWQDKDQDGEVWALLDEHGAETGKEESYLERMLRLRGDINDEDDESLYDGAYYGITLFGWDAGVEVTEAQISVLLALEIVQDWREAIPGTKTPAEPAAAVLTASEAARRLDGVEYGEEDHTHRGLFAEMKAAGLVMVYGASDDLVEFRGAICDEAGGPGTVYLTSAGLLANECDDWDCPHFREAKKTAATIKATFGRGEIDWTFETAIPHHTFMMKEGAGDFCRGLVFALSDVPA